VANVIVTQRSAGNPRGESSVGTRSNDREKRARSEVASLASGNRHLADNDVRRWITQNCYLRECSHDREDLRNIIEDRRHFRARSLTPPRRSLVRDVTPSGRGGFCALVHRSGRLSGQRSSRPNTPTSMMGPTILTSSSRSITLSLRPQEEMIGRRPIICPQHYPAWPDHDLSTCLRDQFTPRTSYVSCSSGTFRARMSIHLLLRLSRPSGKSMMRAFGTT
jgi:hypothetical protein